MSHDIEPPAPPPGDSEEGLPFQRSTTAAPPSLDGPPPSQGHVMSSGAAHHPRPQTYLGVGTMTPADALIPPPPLTEVAPAPEIRRDLASRPGAPAKISLDLKPEDATATTVSPAPRPRPSETMVGSRSPLRTAEEANTQIDVSTLSAADADRILAAADEGTRNAPKRAPTLLSPSSALPPPPPLRRSSFPPPTGGNVPTPLRHASTSPVPPTASSSPVRASQPAPSSQKPKTLLMYGGPKGAAAGRTPLGAGAPSNDRGSIQGLLARHAPGETPKPNTTSASKPPPPVRPRADSVEEISAGFLVDDAVDAPAPKPVPPEPISSSVLQDEPESAPDLELQDYDSAVNVIAPDPFPAPTLPAAAIAPVAPSDADNREANDREAVTQRPEGLYAPNLAPGSDPLVASDPFSRQTDPPRARTTDPPRSHYVSSSPPPPPSGQQPKWLIPAMIVGGAATLAIVVSILMFAIRWVHSTVASTESPKVAPSAAVSATEPSPAPAPSAVSQGVTTAKPRAPSPIGGACILAGAPHVVAPHALLRAGIETASGTDRIALGVALADRDALVVALDPSTFAVVGRSQTHATEPLRRVVPILAPSELTPFMEMNRRHADLEAAHPVAADPPFVVGVAAGKIGWAPSRSAPLQDLWPLVGDAPVEAMRTVVLRDHAGYAIAFRQGSSIFLGGLRPDKTANGELVRVGGLGPQIGAPTLAAGIDHVLVAWADRASPSMPWAVRSLKWRPGTEPGEPTAFPIPVIDSSQQVMSPALASLADGRFVIAWTEGSLGRHDVRVEALDSAGQPIGSALTVSAEGVNAGQGMLALTPDGRGAIAFLATPTGPTASVVAVPIICP